MAWLRQLWWLFMRKARLRWVPLFAAALHVFLFGVGPSLWIQEPPLLNGPSRVAFAIVFLADFPISWVAFGAIFGGWPHALYFLAAWGFLALSGGIFSDC